MYVSHMSGCLESKVLEIQRNIGVLWKLYQQLVSNLFKKAFVWRNRVNSDRTDDQVIQCLFKRNITAWGQL